MRLEGNIRQGTSRPLMDEASDGSEDSTFLVSKKGAMGEESSSAREAPATRRTARRKSTREVIAEMEAKSMKNKEGEDKRGSISPGPSPNRGTSTWKSSRSSSPTKSSARTSSTTTSTTTSTSTTKSTTSSSGTPSSYAKTGRTSTPYKMSRFASPAKPLASSRTSNEEQPAEKTKSSLRSSDPEKHKSSSSSRSSTAAKTRISSPSKTRSSDPEKVKTSSSSGHRSSSPTKSSSKHSTRSSSPLKSSKKSSSSATPATSSAEEAAPRRSSIIKTEDSSKDAAKSSKDADRVRRVTRRSSTMCQAMAGAKPTDAAASARRLVRRKSAGGENALNVFALSKAGAQVVDEDGNKKIIRVKIVPKVKPATVVKGSKPKVRKNVSWTECEPHFQENHLYCEDEVPEMWFDKYDVETFKAELENAIEKITEDERKSEVWRKSLSRAYDMSCTVENEDSFHDPRSATYKLVKFRLKDVFTETMELIGVEHLLAYEIRSDANRRRARVLDLIDKLNTDRQRRKRLGTELEGDKIADLEKINAESLEASRASRFFAHGLALAQHASTEDDP